VQIAKHFLDSELHRDKGQHIRGHLVSFVVFFATWQNTIVRERLNVKVLQKIIHDDYDIFQNLMENKLKRKERCAIITIQVKKEGTDS